MVKHRKEDLHREDLGFRDSVMANLAPLLAEHGIAVKRAEPMYVLFESDKIAVGLSHARISYEIDLSVWRIRGPDTHFSLLDIIDADIGLGHQEPAFFQASSAERVEECITTISSLLGKHGKEVLRGKIGAFRRMTTASAERARKLTREMVGQPLREAAEAAWRSKDFPEVIRIYGLMGNNLSPVEQKRLGYAKQQGVQQ